MTVGDAWEQEIGPAEQRVLERINRNGPRPCDRCGTLTWHPRHCPSCQTIMRYFSGPAPTMDPRTVVRTTYQLDSAGLAMHLSDCAVGCCADDDHDCTCGARDANRLLNDRRRPAAT